MVDSARIDRLTAGVPLALRAGLELGFFTRIGGVAPLARPDTR